MKAVAADLSFPLINAEDVFLNCNAFFCGETNKVAFVPLCEYVYFTGSGVTGKLETPDNLFREYEVLKIKAYELARQNNASEDCIYLSQRETLRFLDNLIKSYIIMGDSKPIVCTKISDWWKYEHVKLARSYFVEYEKTHELDDEMHTFSSCSDADRYYEYCIERIGNLHREKVIYKAKQTIKQIIRKFH